MPARPRSISESEASQAESKACLTDHCCVYDPCGLKHHQSDGCQGITWGQVQGLAASSSPLLHAPLGSLALCRADLLGERLPAARLSRPEAAAHRGLTCQHGAGGEYRWAPWPTPGAAPHRTPSGLSAHVHSTPESRGQSWGRPDGRPRAGAERSRELPALREPAGWTGAPSAGGQPVGPGLDAHPGCCCRHDYVTRRCDRQSHTGS